MFHNADFRQARFGNNLDCSQAVFEKSAIFEGVICGGSGYFRRAAFVGRGSKVTWAGASFGGNLEAIRAIFCSPVSLNRTSCDGSAIFEDALFTPYAPIRSEFSRFGRNLSFIGARVSSHADLTMTAVNNSLKLADSSFRKNAVLYEASVGVVVLGPGIFPFKHESLDLRGFIFQRFEGDSELAFKLIECQQFSTFSRDPYLQFETYYQNSGDELQAQRFHYRGRRDMRRRALTKDEGATWSATERWVDLMFKLLTGYGVQTYRLLLFIAAFLVSGMIVFWPMTALQEGTARVVAAFAYSADLFLPVVDVGLPLNEEPKPSELEYSWRESYAVLHSLIGWVLVPLLVASLSGLVRRR